MSVISPRKRNHVSVAKAKACLRYLAALNHRQVTRWERFITSEIEISPGQAPKAVFSATHPNIAALLKDNALAAIAIVQAITGPFAYHPITNPVLQRKMNQYQSWAIFVHAAALAGQDPWKPQCRTPFIYLTSEQQQADYKEAEADLRAVAAAGRLILPQPLPAVGLHATATLARLRFQHALAHGKYAVSEEPWSKTCQACHFTWRIKCP